ncbi:uncharacterized protein LTR77_001967 [Saxophila tyrrhenica]|uniref:Uncharacterized protein n=1 Tax=Saxophila tyrrhenica TaxID=1690608 RepID=A0AAV9PJ02_9PEZI|nr:hypothetical protein LTR77_001967 [Saxophila tyrrhenica]
MSSVGTPPDRDNSLNARETSIMRLEAALRQSMGQHEREKAQLREWQQQQRQGIVDDRQQLDHERGQLDTDRKAFDADRDSIVRELLLIKVRYFIAGIGPLIRNYIRSHATLAEADNISIVESIMRSIFGSENQATVGQTLDAAVAAGEEFMAGTTAGGENEETEAASPAQQLAAEAHITTDNNMTPAAEKGSTQTMQAQPSENEVAGATSPSQQPPSQEYIIKDYSMAAVVEAEKADSDAPGEQLDEAGGGGAKSKTKQKKRRGGRAVRARAEAHASAQQAQQDDAAASPTQQPATQDHGITGSSSIPAQTAETTAVDTIDTFIRRPEAQALFEKFWSDSKKEK